jgi:hypothetical protein
MFVHFHFKWEKVCILNGQMLRSDVIHTARFISDRSCVAACSIAFWLCHLVVPYLDRHDCLTKTSLFSQQYSHKRFSISPELLIL